MSSTGVPYRDYVKKDSIKIKKGNEGKNRYVLTVEFTINKFLGVNSNDRKSWFIPTFI